MKYGIIVNITEESLSAIFKPFILRDLDLLSRLMKPIILANLEVEASHIFDEIECRVTFDMTRDIYKFRIKSKYAIKTFAAVSEGGEYPVVSMK